MLFRVETRFFELKYIQNGAIIIRLLPHTVLELVLVCTRIKTNYVSIFLILFMLFFVFLFSKIQHKKSFVKCFIENTGYSLNQSIFFEKYITIAKMMNNPKLPASSA